MRKIAILIASVIMLTACSSSSRTLTFETEGSTLSMVSDDKAESLEVGLGEASGSYIQATIGAEYFERFDSVYEYVSSYDGEQLVGLTADSLLVSIDEDNLVHGLFDSSHMSDMTSLYYDTINILTAEEQV